MHNVKPSKLLDRWAIGSLGVRTTIVPNLRVHKCGDFMEHCFTVPDIGHTSGATAKLSAMAFHLFQLHGSAAEVVRVLKQCAQDIGAPGIDREFGQGLVDLRCFGSHASGH